MILYKSFLVTKLRYSIYIFKKLFRYIRIIVNHYDEINFSLF